MTTRTNNGDNLKKVITDDAEQIRKQTIAAIDRHLGLEEGQNPYNELLTELHSFITQNEKYSIAGDLLLFIERLRDFLFDPAIATVFYARFRETAENTLENLNGFISFLQALDGDRCDALIDRISYDIRFHKIERIAKENPECPLGAALKQYNRLSLRQHEQG